MSDLELLIENFHPPIKKTYEQEKYFLVSNDLRKFLPLSETSYQIQYFFKKNYILLTFEEGPGDLFRRWYEEVFLTKILPKEISFLVPIEKAQVSDKDISFSSRYIFGIMKKKMNFHENYSFFLDQKKVQLIEAKEYLKFSQYQVQKNDLTIIVESSQNLIKDFGFFERRFFKNHYLSDFFYLPLNYFSSYFYSKNKKLQEKILPTENLQHYLDSEILSSFSKN